MIVVCKKRQFIFLHFPSDVSSLLNWSSCVTIDSFDLSTFQTLASGLQCGEACSNFATRLQANCPTTASSAINEVRCDATGKIIRIVIQDVPLSGTLGEDIARLNKLTHLEIATTDMHGVLPTSIKELSELRNLYIYKVIIVVVIVGFR
jgi:hypothetical protein